MFYRYLGLLVLILITAATAQAVEPKTGDTMTEAGMQLVYIAPGSFVMGSPESEVSRYSDERQHEVRIEKGFWIGRYEVTFDQYDQFCKETHHAVPDDEKWGRGQRPVIYVPWFDALAFTEWMSKRTGHHYRLPTEAEWEYAARAGTTTAYSWGDDPADFSEYAWNTSNTDSQTHPVGQKKPNPWGLYDMHGNVWEWTASLYSEEYDGAELEDSSTVLPAANERRSLQGALANNYEEQQAQRSVRGGAWYFYPKGMRSADRRLYFPRLRLPYVGFRVVREK